MKFRERRGQRGDGHVRAEHWRARREHLLREGIDLVLRELGDPALADASVLRVEILPESGNAWVYVATDEPAATPALNRAAQRIRRIVGEQLGLKRMPELNFVGVPQCLL